MTDELFDEINGTTREVYSKPISGNKQSTNGTKIDQLMETKDVNSLSSIIYQKNEKKEDVHENREKKQR